MKRLHVAVAQVHSKACDVRGNMERMLRQVRSAAAVGADVILFAETAVHAYDLSAENVALAEPMGGPLTQDISRWAAEHRVAVLAGFLERDGEKVYNSHVVARPDGRMGRERKHKLTEGELNSGLSPGPRERTVFEFEGVRTAVLICADSGTEGIYDELAGQRVDLVFLPTAGGGKLADMIHDTDLAGPEGRAAYETDRQKVFVKDAFNIKDERRVRAFASANALGYDGREACHRGHCMIVDRHGVMRVQIAGTNVLEHQQDQMAHTVLEFPDY